MIQKMENANNGIILINKEAGITSYDVIRKLKPLFPKKTKIGHAGTLDPFATGVLVVLVGKSTKRSSEIMKLSKKYRFRMKFGYETDTQDITGKVTETDKLNEPVNKADLLEVLNSFKGKSLQTPPQYSAKKISGKEAYKYAREGKTVELKSVEVEIKTIELIDYKWPEAEILSEVSSGTYIRSLTVDIARKMNRRAVTVELSRVSVGNFHIDDSISSTEISNIALNKIFYTE